MRRQLLRLPRESHNAVGDRASGQWVSLVALPVVFDGQNGASIDLVVLFGKLHPAGIEPAHAWSDVVVVIGQHITRFDATMQILLRSLL
jgi:hypothetical protein